MGSRAIGSIPIFIADVKIGELGVFDDIGLDIDSIEIMVDSFRCIV
jgi:hypothetical protein